MIYLIDTDICIFIIRKYNKVSEKLRKFRPDDLAISVITLAELYFGAEKSQYTEKGMQAINDFITPYAILPWTEQEAKIYGKIRAELSRTGQVIGDRDIKIAAHALINDLTLVTNNEKEFNRVQRLKIENWAIPMVF